MPYVTYYKAPTKPRVMQMIVIFVFRATKYHCIRTITGVVKK